jgi:hypothetical protein
LATMTIGIPGVFVDARHFNYWNTGEYRMRTMILLTCTVAVTSVSCSSGESSNIEASASNTESEQRVERGGTITVGDDAWTIVPRSCQVHNNDLVNISGHAAKDPSLEISIDFGGPDQVVVGSGNDILWRATKETIEIRVEGRRVQGTASFNAGYAAGSGSADGSFDVTC